MKIHILSLFPDYFRGPFDVSMIKRAKENGILDIELVDLRDLLRENIKKWMIVLTEEALEWYSCQDLFVQRFDI